MSQLYQKILIANEELQDLDVAMEKAALLEHYSGAELLLHEVIYDELEKESDELLPRAEKNRLIDAYMAAERHALEQLAKRFDQRVASITANVGWGESRELEICRYAQQHFADLIIKPMKTETSLKEMLLHPTEHRLLAHAPCPVLLSRLPNWHNSSAVVACVDLADTSHQALNQRIILNARQLAELLGLSLHLLNVVSKPQLSLGRYPASYDPLAAHDKILASRKMLMQLELNSLRNANCEVHGHVKVGRLVDEIRTLADHVGADVVVMGTASREGLRRFLIGNSAEVVLSRLPKDLLCVRTPAE